MLFPVKKLNKNFFEILKEDIHHVVDVLRKKQGDKLKITNGNLIYLAEIVELNKEKIILKKITEIKPKGIKRKNLNMYVGLSKLNTVEKIIKICSELGAKSLTLFYSQFSQHIKVKETRLKRWKKIARESAIQAERINPLNIEILQDFEKMINSLKPENTVFFHTEGNFNFKNLRKLIKREDEINLVIGSEGGFSHKEIKEISQSGFMIVTLPFNILRVETCVYAGIILTRLIETIS